MADDGDAWSLEETRETRPYALTGGRTRPRHSMRLDTQLVTRSGADVSAYGPEAQTVMELCREGVRSIAEIAGSLRSPVLTTKVLVSDLIEADAVVAIAPSAPPDVQILTAVLTKLRARSQEIAREAA